MFGHPALWFFSGEFKHQDASFLLRSTAMKLSASAQKNPSFSNPRMLKIIVSSNNPRHYNGIKNIPGPTILRCHSGRKCLKCLVGRQKYVHLYSFKSLSKTVYGSTSSTVSVLHSIEILFPSCSCGCGSLFKNPRFVSSRT